MDNYSGSDKLRYGPDEDYVITAARFCNQKFSNVNATHTREYIAYTEPIKHMKCNEAIDQRCKIKGIMSMYCFIFNKEANVTYTRFLSCACDKCRTLDIDIMGRCANQSTVGVLVRRESKRSCNKKPPHKRRRTNMYSAIIAPK